MALFLAKSTKIAQGQQLSMMFISWFLETIANVTASKRAAKNGDDIDHVEGHR